MDSLLRKDNLKAVRKGQGTLPKGLDGIYNEAMQRIRSQDEETAQRAEQVLSWLAYALRPLTFAEIQHALAVEPGEAEFGEDAAPDEDFLVPICAGLVTIDKESSIVRLVHYTTQEYFERTQASQFSQARVMIAMTCLTYVSFDVFADGHCLSDENTQVRMREYPLLEYASRHWGDHACSNPEEAIEERTLEFLGNEFKLACSVQMMHLSGYHHPEYSQSFPRNVKGLHVAASFGLSRIVRRLLEREDVNSTDVKVSNGRTPLSLAAEKGYVGVVSLLLQKGAEVATKDGRGSTVLHWAYRQGHGNIARLLLEKGANPDESDKLGATPLY